MRHRLKISACLETFPPTLYPALLGTHYNPCWPTSRSCLPPTPLFGAASLLHLNWSSSNHAASSSPEAALRNSSLWNCICCTVLAGAVAERGLGAAVPSHHHPALTTHIKSVARRDTVLKWSLCTTLFLAASSLQEAQPVAQQSAVHTAQPWSGPMARH